MKYKFIDKTLFFPLEKTLVISDLHIGHEESLRNAGIFLPKQQFKQIRADFEKVIRETGKLDKIVILGDLKHEFGRISDQEWKEVGEFLDLAKKIAEKVVLIKGNHDKILGPIAQRKEIEVKDFYIDGENCFIHGDKQPIECLDKKVKRIIMGHKHPAITLSEGAKQEKYKCFLVGEWKKKEIIILPSFFPLIEGSDIINFEDNNLAFKFNFREFRAYAIGDKVYDFGKLKKIGKLNS